MINTMHIKNDLKQIFKNPIVAALFILPLFLAVFARLVITVLLPYLSQYVVLNAAPYYSFILAALITEAPVSLGIVTGFIMLDDRDGNIFDLMRVTPLGTSGYIVNRLAFPFISSFLFTFIVYFIVNIYCISVVPLILLALIMGLISIIISMIMFFIATDKVKGLTYAKALNLFSLFTLADLLELKWFSAISHVVPSYWVTKIVQNPTNPLTITLSFVVCCIWAAGALWFWKKKV